jgi:hypothetical protein
VSWWMAERSATSTARRSSSAVPSESRR